MASLSSLDQYRILERVVAMLDNHNFGDIQSAQPENRARCESPDPYSESLDRECEQYEAMLDNPDVGDSQSAQHQDEAGHDSLDRYAEQFVASMDDPNAGHVEEQAHHEPFEGARRTEAALRSTFLLRRPPQLTQQQAATRQPVRGEQPRDGRPHDSPSVPAAFFDHSSARRVSTDTVIASAVKAQYPDMELTIALETNCQLIPFAGAGHASFEKVADTDVPLSNLSWTLFSAPLRRLDGGNGSLGVLPLFAKYLYRWNKHEFIIYHVDGRDGVMSYPSIRNFYILSRERRAAEDLVLAAGRWTNDLHGEIFVFDQGNWTKSAELFASVRDARWENVILDKDMKKAIIDDHLSFFHSRDTYAGLKVPWKRGIIYHGPPGNGKTISIKATMNMLYREQPEIPTLYVRSLASWAGPEYSVRQIFSKARQFAPCYLVFEDLDTIVSDSVRSYFLNEVDGLKNNDGIFMVGSTNHLDRLDPGISKRPSRFDRKYYFPNPDLQQRIAYCHFWQRKLADKKDLEFPDELCNAIAAITKKFSFAYMQEAFVAALLAIARRSALRTAAIAAQDGNASDSDWVGVDGGDDQGHDDAGEDQGDDLGNGSGDDPGDLDKYVLWVEIKKQIAILREGMESKA